MYWSENPLGYLEEGNSFPYANGGVPKGYDDDVNWYLTSIVQRWAFGTSYLTVPASWQPDSPAPRYIPVDETPHLFQTTGGQPLQLSSGRNISEVVSPGQKVWIHEEFDRQQKGEPYFAYDHARAEKLMFDLSVNDWSSGSANSSIVPERGNGVWRQKYVPLDTFPIPLGGLGDQTRLDQRYRWTFRGLAGSDYGPIQSPRGPRVQGSGW